MTTIQEALVFRYELRERHFLVFFESVEADSKYTLIHALTSAFHIPSASSFDAIPTDLPKELLNKLQNRTESSLLYWFAHGGKECQRF
jgi:hypothetical protein